MAVVIEKDWKALIGNACWAWLLAWIPTGVLAAIIALSSHHFDGTTFTFTHGLITRKTDTIDLRRVRKIDSEDNPFTGGKLIFTETNGLEQTIRFVKHPAKVARQLRAILETTSRENGETVNRVIS